MSQSTKIIIGVVVGLGILLAGAMVFGPQAIQYALKKEALLTKEQSDALAQSAADELTKGNLTAARSQFEDGIAKSMDLEEKARFETLLASSYVADDLTRAADLYMSVFTNTSYTQKSRNSAGVQLLVALGSYRSPSVAQRVFSEPPFEGFWNNNVSDPELNYEIALSRGHEHILQTYPNFLSHLIVGEFYARKYPYLTESQKKFYAPRITAYYEEGNRELLQAQNDPFWDETRVAIGYFNRALYVRAYEYLVRSKRLAAPEGVTLDQKAVLDAHGSALTFFGDHVTPGPFKAQIEFLTRVNQASFMLSISSKDTITLTALSNAIAEGMFSDGGVAKAVDFIGGSRKLRDVDLRKVLVTLASSYSPTLKDALLQKTTTFTPADFK